mgnify:CR=1 FL=1|tara:strand:- start:102004 stop:103419 length:1416 start_codon:yes stop_codon:yes gene_type:complete
MGTGERLMDARCRLVTRLPWYGTMAQQFTWVSDPSVKTMGVSIVQGGRVICYYAPDFCDSLTIMEMAAVVRHEIEHIVRLHILRVGSRKHKMWNIAGDMVINGKKSNPQIPELPGGKFEGTYYPEEWDWGMTTEEVYHKLDNIKVIAHIKGGCPKCGKGERPQPEPSGGDQEGNQEPKNGDEKQDGSEGGDEPGENAENGESGDGGPGGGCGTQGPPEDCPSCGEQAGGSGESRTEIWGNPNGTEVIEIEIGDGMDNHDPWRQSTASEEEARQRVKEMCRRASQTAGATPGHMIDAISALDDPVISWRYELKQVFGRVLGGRRRTWARVNRRDPRFGTKGKSSHARTPITLAVDTSGSMCKKRLEQAFGEIEGAAQKTKTTLVQFDHGYQCHSRYRKGDWARIEIKGRGGTSFVKAFQAMETQRLVGKLNIIITDGEAPWPPEPDWPILWVILNSKDRIKPPFGRVIYIDK